MTRRLTAVALLAGLGCTAPELGILPSRPAPTTVRLDFSTRPLPEIPLPNDLATRYDATSPTRRRVNASLVAPTAIESRARVHIDELDGWGTFQPITIPFTGDLDPISIRHAHPDDDRDHGDDAIFLVNVDRDSPSFGRVHPLDFGNGYYPVVMERTELWKADPRGFLSSQLFEEVDEDRNGNGVLDVGVDLDGDGVLDPPEDTDADGVLDRPNWLPGIDPPADRAARADALMSFYDAETRTVIARPVLPLEERTTYAVVVTRRVRDAFGRPVGSPYLGVNHEAQTPALLPLLEVLPRGLDPTEIAFAFSFTTQSVESDWRALRDGLHGEGVQKHLGASFPPEVGGLLPLLDREVFPTARNVHVIHTEDWLKVFEDAAPTFFDFDQGSELYHALIESQRYVDFHAIGWFESPRLFRDGAKGTLDDRSWPPDLSTRAATAAPERIHFWLIVPRKEVSARGQGKPAPLIVLSHGYSSNRLELVVFGGHYAKHGFAVVAIDSVGHGLGVHDLAIATVRGLAERRGLAPFVDAAVLDRARDENGDHTRDSGADFLTAYLFHTRDSVRQTALDFMQLVRVFRSFDGTRRWGIDANQDGTPELAGDFDADGVVDTGGPGLLAMTGASLGGIMTTVVGSLEPEIDLVAPISAGGGLSEIGARSEQDPVRAAVVLRLMAPIFTGTRDAATGELLLEQLVPDLNHAAYVPIARVSGVEAWDSLLVEDLASGKTSCGYVDASGRVSASIAADLADPIALRFYRGPVVKAIAGGGCVVLSDHTPFRVVETFERDVYFQEVLFEKGRRLEALAEGYGVRRASPEVRRLLGLGQLVLDPADPAVLARHLQAEPLAYADGSRTGAGVLQITTVGDMDVPASGGVAIGRAAGLIDDQNLDPRYGKTPFRVLADTYTVEGVDTIARFRDRAGKAVHMDVENLSRGTDMWGSTIPRLSPPLHLTRRDALGGVSASLFAYVKPWGQHVIDLPGGLTDLARDQCKARCASPGGCGCATLRSFDDGRFVLNQIGTWLASGGKTLRWDLCLSYDDCPGTPPLPGVRDPGPLR